MISIASNPFPLTRAYPEPRNTHKGVFWLWDRLLRFIGLRSDFKRVLEEDIKVVLTNGDKLMVPQGFVSDFASVPRILWSLISPWGRDELAFIVHDYLYKHAKEMGYDRYFCDLQMFMFQAFTGADGLRSGIMYRAVRMFGWYFFNKHN